jgi:hypothetical protein
VDGFQALLFWLTSLTVEGRIVSFLMRWHVKFKNHHLLWGNHVSSWIQGSFQIMITSCNIIDTNSVGIPSLIWSNIEMGEVLYLNKTFLHFGQTLLFRMPRVGRSKDD